MSNNWQKNLGDFDSYVYEKIEEWKVPGIALAVVKDGEVIISRGYGTRNINDNKEVTEDTIFPIASASKAFTATAAGILVDEGKLEWDAPIINYIPWFKMYDPVATKRVTIRDMLCHRTGLPRHELMWSNESFTKKELVERVRYLQPSKDFRSAFQYQNQMFTTVGYLVEEISGMTWEQFVQKRIFDPLEMYKSNFSVEYLQKMPNHSKPHKEENGEVREIPFRNIEVIGPAGSINSNIREMANWLLLNLSKGKYNDKQVISEDKISQLHMPQIPCKMFSWDFIEAPFSNYGLGWFVDCFRGYKHVNHGGTVDGFNSQVSFMPDENIGIVILSNKNSSLAMLLALQYEIYDRLLGYMGRDWNKAFKDEYEKILRLAGEEKEKKINLCKHNTQTSHKLDEYAGIYENPGYGKMAISVEGDGLRIEYKNRDFKTVHHHYDIFRLELETAVYIASFKMDKNGDIDRLLVAFEPDPAVNDIEFIKSCKN